MTPSSSPSASEPLFSWPTIAWSVAQGGAVLLATGALYALAPGRGLSTDQARAVTFAALVMAVVALILVDRSASSSILTAIRRPNRALAAVLPIIAVLLAATLLWPPARALFGFGALPARWWLVPPATGLAILVALEALKPIWRRATRTGGVPPTARRDARAG